MTMDEGQELIELSTYYRVNSYKNERFKMREGFISKNIYNFHGVDVVEDNFL